MAKAIRIAAKVVAALLGGTVLLVAVAWFSPPVATFLAEQLGGRSKRVPPVRIADNLYFVGASDISSFLLVGSEGDILIDGGYAGTAPQILDNIRALGFDPHDIKIILNTHGHFDHAAGIAALKRETGASLYASPREKELLEAGGRGDYYYGDHLAYEPVKVDHVLTDGETVRLGDVALTAHFTPGHTKGCTSWEMPLTIDGGAVRGLLICSLSLVGTPSRDNPDYPEMVTDFEASFARLKTLPCEVFLLPHAKSFGFAAKAEALARGERRAFLDPAGCAAFIASSEQKLRDALN